MYKSDQHICAELGLTAQQWKELRYEFERRGMPKPDELTGMRWWPAVEEWFNRRHRLPEYRGASAPTTQNFPSVEMTENLNALSRSRRKAAGCGTRLGGLST